MTIITRESLEIIDRKIAWLNSRDNITVDKLDNTVSHYLIGADSVFNSDNRELIAMKNCGRLAYYVSYTDDKEYPHSVFSLFFKVNIEDSENINADFTNCLIEKGTISYNIYDLDDPDHLEKWNKDKECAMWFDNEVEEYLEKNPDLTQAELKEVLDNYNYNRIDN